MEPFFPTLPFIIPHSEGTAIWWDIAWWVFQIVIMTVLVVLITKWAVNMDKEFDSTVQKTGKSANKPAGKSVEQ